MRTTISLIKADVGSIGGHVAPSIQLMDSVREHVMNEVGGLLADAFVTATGDDIEILMTHERGAGDATVHRLGVGRIQGRHGSRQEAGFVWRRPGPARQRI